MVSFLEPLPERKNQPSIEQHIRKRFAQENKAWRKRLHRNGIIPFLFRALAAGIHRLVSPQEVKKQPRFSLPVQMLPLKDGERMLCAVHIPSYEEATTKEQRKEQEQRRKDDLLACRPIDAINVEQTIRFSGWMISFLAQSQSLDRLFAHPQFKKMENLYCFGSPQETRTFNTRPDGPDLKAVLRQAFKEYKAPWLVVRFDTAAKAEEQRQEQAEKGLVSSNAYHELSFEIEPAYTPQQRSKTVHDYLSVIEIDIETLAQTPPTVPVRFAFCIVREEMEIPSSQAHVETLEKTLFALHDGPFPKEPR